MEGSANIPETRSSRLVWSTIAVVQVVDTTDGDFNGSNVTCSSTRVHAGEAGLSC